jgi:hypothetical protein
MLLNGHTGVIHCRRQGRTVHWRTTYAGLNATAATGTIFLDPSALGAGFQFDLELTPERAVLFTSQVAAVGAGYLYISTWEVPTKKTAAPWWALPAGTRWDVRDNAPIPTSLPGTLLTTAP